MPGDEAAIGIRSAFVPEFALQGQAFSGHILWSRSAKLVRLTLSLPDGISLKHLYNVPKSAATTQGTDTLEVSAVESDGYAGFVLESRRFESPDVTLQVKIQLRLEIDGASRTEERLFSTNLFRPSIWVETSDRTLTAEFVPGDSFLRIKEPIHITNEGKGTALVIVAPKGMSPDMVTDYMLQDDVRKTYMRVINERFATLETEFPGSESFLELWRHLFEFKSSRLDEKSLSQLEKLQESSKQLESKSPDLLEAIGEALWDALLAIFTIDQRFKSWAETMNATLAQSVVLLNPSTAVKLEAGDSSLDFDLTPVDLLGHAYPVIPLRGIKVHAKSAGTLPLFELLTTTPLPTEHPGERPRRSSRRGSN
jgi:hypothetical protein